MSKDASSPKEHPIAEQQSVAIPNWSLSIVMKSSSVHLLSLNTELIKFETFKEVYFEYSPKMTDPCILDSLDFD